MRKDGSLLDVVLTISPMKDAAGRVVGASKLARDITERKRAEEILRQAQADLAYINRVTTMGELTASLRTRSGSRLPRQSPTLGPACGGFVATSPT